MILKIHITTFTDHDYIELLVNVKSESDSNMSELEEEPELVVPEDVTIPAIQIKEEVITEDSKSMFDNLATLAEVSLASAGQLEDKSLKRKIDQARAKISQTILPITPEMSSKRTMQVHINKYFNLHVCLSNLVFVYED